MKVMLGYYYRDLKGEWVWYEEEIEDNKVSIPKGAYLPLIIYLEEKNNGVRDL